LKYECIGEKLGNFFPLLSVFPDENWINHFTPSPHTPAPHVQSAASSEQLYVAIFKKDSQGGTEGSWSQITNSLTPSQKVNQTSLSLTLVNPSVEATGQYECRTKFDVYNATSPKQNLGIFSDVFNVTIQGGCQEMVDYLSRI
jgi:hypothetical protein